MTWREFQLRRSGYLRSEREDWKKARLTAYYALAATGAIDTRKMSIEHFMPLDEQQSKYQVTEDGFAALKREQEKYLEKANGSRI